MNTTTTIPTTECPLFPVRRAAGRSLCPIRAEELEFPTVQHRERSIVDTNRMYRSFRQMECEGRTSSLQPTIIISAKPQTQLHTVVDERIMSIHPLSSTLEYAQKKEKLYDEEEMKTNEEWFQSEIKEKEHEESTLFHQQQECEISVHDVSNKDQKYWDENESEKVAKAANAEVQRIDFDTTATSSFSLQQLSSMLIAVLLTRTVQKTNAERSTGANDTWNDPAAATSVNGMQVVMVNVALVM